MFQKIGETIKGFNNLGFFKEEKHNNEVFL